MFSRTFDSTGAFIGHRLVGLQRMLAPGFPGGEYLCVLERRAHTDRDFIQVCRAPRKKGELAGIYEIF